MKQASFSRRTRAAGSGGRHSRAFTWRWLIAHPAGHVGAAIAAAVARTIGVRLADLDKYLASRCTCAAQWGTRKPSVLLGLSAGRPIRAMIERMRPICRNSKHAGRPIHRFPHTLPIGPDTRRGGSARHHGVCRLATP
jgi:hypothetical protein